MESGAGTLGPGLSQAGRFRAGTARTDARAHHRDASTRLLWFFGFARIDRDQREPSSPARSSRSSTIMRRRDHAIHDAGGEVLNWMGDGVLGDVHTREMAVAKTTALRAEPRSGTIWLMSITSRGRRGGGDAVRSACMSVKSSMAISAAKDRLRFHGGGAGVTERSAPSLDVPFGRTRIVTSQAFRTGLDALRAKNIWCRRGALRLRGTRPAQESLYAIPISAADEVMAGKDGRYLAK